MNNYIKLISDDINRIEEIIDNFHIDSPRKDERPSMFNMKFFLNNVRCESEHDLSKFSLVNLQKLVIFTTQNCK